MRADDPYHIVLLHYFSISRTENVNYLEGISTISQEQTHTITAMKMESNNATENIIGL